MTSMEWLNFRHLYAFWMVKKTGGFKSAADEIKVSQSTISEQVTLLEGYFEKSLFQRNTREVKLTEIGQELFVYADSIFEKSRQINILIRDEDRVGPTTLKAGIIGGVSRNLVYRFLKEPLEQGVISNFEVFNGSLNRLLDACLNYEIDFFISVVPPSGKDLAMFESQVIAKSNICIAGDKKIISKIKRPRKSPIHLDLYNYKFPFFEGDIVSKFSKRKNIDFNLKLNTDDISLLRFFANSHEGISLIPEIGIMEDFHDKRLDKMILSFVKPISFYAIYPKVSAKTPLLEQLLNNFK